MTTIPKRISLDPGFTPNDYHSNQHLYGVNLHPMSFHISMVSDPLQAIRLPSAYTRRHGVHSLKYNSMQNSSMPCDYLSEEEGHADATFIPKSIKYAR